MLPAVMDDIVFTLEKLGIEVVQVGAAGERPLVPYAWVGVVGSQPGCKAGVDSAGTATFG
jgi:hypothetical protein